MGGKERRSVWEKEREDDGWGRETERRRTEKKGEEEKNGGKKRGKKR